MTALLCKIGIHIDTRYEHSLHRRYWTCRACGHLKVRHW